MRYETDDIYRFYKKCAIVIGLVLLFVCFIVCTCQAVTIEEIKHPYPAEVNYNTYNTIMGGYNTIYYLHNEKDSVNSSLYVMDRSIPNNPETNITTTVKSADGLKLIAEFITPSGDPNILALTAGDRQYNTWVMVDNTSTGPSYLNYRVYVYHINGTKSLIYQFNSQAIDDITPTPIFDVYTLSENYPMNSTDRFFFQYYAYTTSAANRQVTIYFDGNTKTSKIFSPIAFGASGTSDHGLLSNLSSDSHSQYALLSGRPAGQTLNGSNAANGDITISGTSSSTKTLSYVILQPDGGKVGIGTLSPAFTLDVSGGNGVRIQYGEYNTTLSTSSSGYFYIKPANFRTYYDAPNGNNGYYVTDYTQGNGNYTYVDGNKIVLYNKNVQTTRISAKDFSSFFNGLNTSFGGTTATAQIDNYGQQRIRSLGAGTVYADSNGVLYTVSDTKTKTNIKEYNPDAISKIKQMPSAKTYNWAADTGLSTTDTNLGFIAQELKAVLPEAVSEKKDGYYTQILKKKGKTSEEDEYESIFVPTGTTTETVSDRAIIALLVDGMKEQQAQIEQLRAEVARLEGKKVDKVSAGSV